MIGNRKWDYPHDCCETLCKGCHAEEHGITLPRFGWEFIGHNDLGDVVGTCEYCGTSIRHVFLIQNENWVSLEVGTICCDHLTDTRVASDFVDSERRFNERRKRFVSSSRWRKDPSGGLCIRKNKIKVEILRLDASFRIYMNGRRGKNHILLQLLEAKMKAFDSIETGAAGRYLKQLARPASTLTRVR